MSMRGRLIIKGDVPDEYVQEVLPGFEEVLEKGMNVTVSPTGIRLTPTRERRILRAGQRNREGAGDSAQ